VQWEGQNIKFPVVFRIAGKNQEQINEKLRLLRKIGF